MRFVESLKQHNSEMASEVAVHWKNKSLKQIRLVSPTHKETDKEQPVLCDRRVVLRTSNCSCSAWDRDRLIQLIVEKVIPINCIKLTIIEVDG